MPDIDQSYMHRCIELARLGAGTVAPNPMVGAVLVYQGRIIGEGYHRQYGEAHAEVNCINHVAADDPAARGGVGRDDELLAGHVQGLPGEVQDEEAHGEEPEERNALLGHVPENAVGIGDVPAGAERRLDGEPADQKEDHAARRNLL